MSVVKQLDLLFRTVRHAFARPSLVRHSSQVAQESLHGAPQRGSVHSFRSVLPLPPQPQQVKKRNGYNAKALANVIKLAQAEPDSVRLDAEAWSFTRPSRLRKKKKLTTRSSLLVPASSRASRIKVLGPPSRDPQEWLPHETVLLRQLLLKTPSHSDIDWEAWCETYFPTKSSLDLYSYATYDVKPYLHCSMKKMEGAAKHKHRLAHQADAAPWSVQELRQLDYYVERYKHKQPPARWQMVAKAMHHARSPKMYELKWTDRLKHVSTGRWRPADDALLRSESLGQLLKLYPTCTLKELMARIIHLRKTDNKSTTSDVPKWPKATLERIMAASAEHGRKPSMIANLLREEMPSLLSKKDPRAMIQLTHAVRKTMFLLTKAKQSRDKSVLQAMCNFPVDELALDNWSLRSTRWTKEEHEKLLQAVEKYGVKQTAFVWIAKEVGRSCTACWCHYHRVILRPESNVIKDIDRYKLVRCLLKYGRKFSHIHRAHMLDFSAERLRGIANAMARQPASLQEQAATLKERLEKAGQGEEMEKVNNEIGTE